MNDLSPDARDRDLCALMGSRLCHDLIGPLGAISNGMELLEMTTENTTPEMELIRQSVDNVNARIKLFRIAFGLAGAEQQVGRAEVAGILQAYFAPSRVEAIWHVQEDMPRRETKAALLAMLCAEGALPLGGTVDIRRTEGRWHITGSGPRIRIVEEAWNHLAGTAPVPEGAPHVHFALLRAWCLAEQRALGVEWDAEDGVSIAF